ncbi:MAG: hypothetical protein WCL02_02130 [bacterium]
MQIPWSGKDYKTLDLLANSSDATQYTNFFAKSQELAKDREG